MMINFEKRIAELEKKAQANVAGNLVGAIVGFFITAWLLMIVCNVLIPYFPWLAALGGLTYWDWVALHWGLRYVTGMLGRIFHRI